MIATTTHHPHRRGLGRAWGPVLTLAALLVAPAAPTSGQGYGTSAAVAGGDALVGESLNERVPGYVYVYRAGDGGWTEVQRLQASDAAQADHFGRSMAVVDGDLLVGATVANDTSGAVYVYRKDGDGRWAEVRKIAAEDGTPGDAWGRTMASGGGLVLVSAWGHADSRGAVYVLAKDEGGEWGHEAKLSAGDGAPNDAFGTSVATDGEHALVGVPQANGRRGAVYVFRRGDGGAWTQTAKLEMEDANGGAGFGMSVAVRHGMALVGAPGHDGFAGAVFGYVLDEASGEWLPNGTYRAFDGERATQFGMSLAHEGYDVWIGAPGAGGGEGRYYVMSWDDDRGEWGSLSKFAVDGLARGDGLGQVVALGSEFSVVGLPRDDFGMGSASIATRDADGWTDAVRTVSEIAALDAITGGNVDCDDGSAGEFGCADVDIVSFLPVQAIGGTRGVEVNDVWGWTDPVTGTEWALVGRYDGTSFIDLSDPANPVYAGNLPLTEGARPNVWRDIKVYDDHAFIVADGSGEHGMQVFDLTRLREPRDGPETFEATAHYDLIQSAHNIVINEETGFAYAVGASGGGGTCGGGLHMIDVRVPTEPAFAGCFADASTGRRGTGYSHDAMCTVYRGPDEEHRGKEICFGSNETALSIADVSDKENPVALAMASYPNAAYSHQGWIDEAHEYFYMNDELDELSGGVSNTRTLVWDVKDLDEPVLAKEHVSENTSSDHNLYILGDLMYQSNYVSGLRILDISDRENPEEVAFFDTVPWTPDAPGFDGSWSNYPYFESGVIVVTSGKEGVFVLRKAERNLIP